MQPQLLDLASLTTGRDGKASSNILPFSKPGPGERGISTTPGSQGYSWFI